ncbi:hypothetical protein O6P43_000516 [Quillaja saponaria]|uniref:Uncharacterized protein n=1 Tax=Quillaja saponaria TaxID=32244 RepID=A0AAD7QGW0_QUISA|nr:hypothetical protein O6P43_000516 [Quillaja saponaria]
MLTATLKQKKEPVKASLRGSSTGINGWKSWTWVLIKVPTGPYPLHNKGSPPSPGQMLTTTLKEEKEAVSSNLCTSTSGINGWKSWDWQLSKVPSDPNPITNEGRPY